MLPCLALFICHKHQSGHVPVESNETFTDTLTKQVRCHFFNSPDSDYMFADTGDEHTDVIGTLLRVESICSSFQASLESVITLEQILRDSQNDNDILEDFSSLKTKLRVAIERLECVSDQQLDAAMRLVIELDDVFQGQFAEDTGMIVRAISNLNRIKRGFNRPSTPRFSQSHNDNIAPVLPKGNLKHARLYLHSKTTKLVESVKSYLDESVVDESFKEEAILP